MLIQWSELVEWPGILIILSLTFVVYFFGGLTVTIGLAGTLYLFTHILETNFFGGLTVTIGLPEDIVILLEHNPHLYLDYMRNAFLFLILPPAVALTFTVIGFIRERKSPNGLLTGWLPLTVIGGFLVYSEVYSIQWTYTQYLRLMREVESFGFVDLAEPILKIYAAELVGIILWLILGLLLMLSPVFKMMVREKDASTTN